MKEILVSVVAVIPALNECTTIAAVIESLRSYLPVIVVDDGSTDSTGDVAREAGALVVRHEKNCGYDDALSTGLKRAAQSGYQFAVTLDADGQHNPELIVEFIELLSRGYDIVIGVRDRMQRFSEKIFAWWARRLWGIEDPLCGMKGYRLASFSEAPAFNSYQSIGTIYTVIAGKSAFKIAQISVQTRERVGRPRFSVLVAADFLIMRAMLRGLLLTKAIVAGA